MPSSHEDVVPFSSLRSDAVTTVVSSSAPDLSTHKRLQCTSETPPGIIHLSKLSKISDANFPALPGQLGRGHNELQQWSSTSSAGSNQQHKATYHAQCERKVNSNELKWGLPRYEFSERHMSQQHTLLPMPSGAEGPGQIVTGTAMTPPVDSRLSSPPSSCRPPPGIDTTCKCSELLTESMQM